MTRWLATAALVWAMLAVVSGAVAQEQAAATYPVSGVVLNGLTRRPIARVLVDAQVDAVLTDGEGHFELKLPAGFSSINVTRPGFGIGRGRRDEHRVNVGANMPELTFLLMPSATISGHVSLSNGDEADGFRIQLYRKVFENGHESWQVRSSARTDSEGQFRMGELEAGTYLLLSEEMMDGRGSAVKGAVRYGYPSVIYPGVSDPAAAGLLVLRPGQQATADFVLTRQVLFPVTITVANKPDGRPVGMQIYDTSGRWVGAATQWDQQEQVARTNLPNGRYYAQVNQRGGQQEFGRVEFTVAGRAVSGLSMTLFPLQPVMVHVRKEFTVAGQDGGFTGGGDQQSAGLNLTLRSAEAFESNGMGGNLRHPEGSADPSLFELNAVTPGRYWVSTTAYQGYVSSISSGGVDLMREPLTIGEGNSTAPIEVVLRNDAGTITGQLTPGSGTDEAASGGGAEAPGELKQAMISAVPLFPSSEQVHATTVANGSGEFSIGNLTPGSYRVFALDQSVDVGAMLPEERQRYMNGGTTVKVDAGGTANVQLQVISVADAVGHE
jgi:hypothetical protein